MTHSVNVFSVYRVIINLDMKSALHSKGSCAGGLMDVGCFTVINLIGDLILWFLKRLL